MKERYDFSKGARRKFHREGAAFRLPVYLDEKGQDYLAAKVDVKGVDLADLVNDSTAKSANFGRSRRHYRLPILAAHPSGAGPALLGQLAHTKRRTWWRAKSK